MKKNKIATLLLLAPLTGCSFSQESFCWDPYKNQTVAMNLQSEKFQNYKLVDTDASYITDITSEIDNIVSSKGSARKLQDKFLELDARVNRLYDSYIIATTKYYANSDEEYEEKAEKLYSNYTNYATWFYDVEDRIYHSSNELKAAYFGDASDEEIEEYLSMSTELTALSEYEEEFRKIETRGEELYNGFYTGGLSKGDYITQGLDLYFEYIEKANELVPKTSYDNYLDYKYEDYYERDYTIEDGKNFVENVKNYILPIYKAKESLSTPRTVDKNLLKKFTSYNFCNDATDMSNMFQAYAEEMGGSFLTSYNKTFKDGYYCFTDSMNSLSSAFEWNLNSSNDAVLYFSRTSQNILSVVHEFGHLYSSLFNNGARSRDSLDMLETFSQADEFTFLTYLLKVKTEDANYDMYKFYVDNAFYDTLWLLINCACITEIEYTVFTEKNLTRQSLESKVNQIINSYQGAASDYYFVAPCVCNCCYYISYATSVIEAVQFGYMGFDEAKSNYTKLVEAPDDFSTVERWENAGCKSPFEEDTFKYLSGLLTEIAAKY